MEEKRYKALLIGPIRKWWDSKGNDEKIEIVYDVMNTVVGATLIVGTAVATKQIVQTQYKIQQNQERINALKEKQKYTEANIFFDVNSKDNVAQLKLALIDPNTGDIMNKCLLTGNLETFGQTTKNFNDAAAYIASKTKADEYARVIFDQSGLHKYHKPMQ